LSRIKNFGLSGGGGPKIPPKIPSPIELASKAVITQVIKISRFRHLERGKEGEL
jgi:hypothetical protein